MLIALVMALPHQTRFGSFWVCKPSHVRLKKKIEEQMVSRKRYGIHIIESVIAVRYITKSVKGKQEQAISAVLKAISEAASIGYSL